MVSMSMSVVAAEVSAAAPATRPAPAGLPSLVPGVKALQVPVGDVRNPPQLDPATGARVGLAAKPEETPKGAHLVGQSATSDTYALAEGKFLLRTHSHPVNWQDPSGVFHRVDLGLSKGSDGRWRPKSSPVGTSFADSAPAGAVLSPGGHTVQLDGAGWSVGFDLLGGPALSAKVVPAKVVSDSASYGLGTGVTLVEQTMVDGVKESIRLDAAPAGVGDVSYSFGVDAHGVVPSVDANGTVVFTAGDGSVVASVPVGAAVDSAAPAPAHSPVAVALTGGSGRWGIRVTTLGTWVRDPARVFPIVVDPSLQAGRGGAAAQDDAFVWSAYPTTNYHGASQYDPNYGNYVDYVGMSGTSSFNTLLRWNLAPLIGTNKGIVSASLSLKVLANSPTAGTGYRVQPLAQDFSTSTVTWNNQPVTFGGAESTLPATAVGGQSSADVTAMVSDWATGYRPTFGGWATTLLSPYFQAGYSVFGAAAATGRADPVLQVTYADLPAATIVSPTVQYLPCPHPDRSVNYCAPMVGTTSPTITLAQAGNPAGHSVQYWYQIFDTRRAPNGVSVPNYGDVVNSGWVSSLSWAPPTGSLVDGRPYALYVYTLVDGVLNLPSVGEFEVRLVAPDVTPTDSVGPVSVNLATGSPRLALGSQSFAGAGGPIGLGLDYDPQRAISGLQANYYDGCTATTSPWPAPAVTRTDPVVSFNWGNSYNSSPAIGTMASGTNFCALWQGYVTVPYTGTWQLGALGVSDGVMIQVGSTMVLSDWADHTGTNEFCTGVTPAACNQTLQAGVAYPITMWYYNHATTQKSAQIQLGVKGPINPDGTYAAGQLNLAGVPAPWLMPPDRSVAGGWRLTVPTPASAYTSATMGATGVTVNTFRGPGRYYNWDVINQTYSPPDSESGSLRKVTEAGALRWKLADGDITYTFDNAGRLLSTVSGADLSNPASPSYTYDAASGHITTVIDPVSGRHLDAIYGTRVSSSDPNCHVTGTAAFDPDPPIGSLCKITLPDGSTDRLYYRYGQLARLVSAIPSGSTNLFGGNITDMGYDAQSRLTSVRDPLGSDQVAAGTAAADTTSATVIAYDATTGNVSGLTAPKAQAADTTRITHTYQYVSVAETRVHIAGFTEPGTAPWARKVTFDLNGRLTADTDPAGLSATTSYDNLDQPLAATATTGMRTATFYDIEGRQTESYGPAAATLFDTTDRPAAANTARVPHAVTGIDEGLRGLAAEYYNSTDLSGAPVAKGLTIGDGANNFYNTYPASPAPGVNATNWSARLSGRITWPVTGNYQISAASAGGMRVWIDGTLVDDAFTPAHAASWAANPGNVPGTAGTTSRVMIEYYNTAYNPGLVQLTWQWQINGGSWVDHGNIPTSALAPNLGVVTSSTDADGHKTATEYNRPELGTMSATVADPAGLALRTTQAHDGLLRPTGTRLPANSYPQAVRADNPAAYWRLSDHSYQTLTDASGHNLAGSYSGPGVTLAQPSALKADDDPAIALDGATGTATIADNAALRMERTQTFTVEAWVNTTTSTGFLAVASKMANVAPYQGWELGITAGKPYLFLINTWSTNAIYRTGSNNVADGQWHHLVATYDGSSRAAGVNFSVDGTADAAPTTVVDTLTATTISAAPVTIGSRAASAYYFPGRLDDIAVYPTVLPAARVAVHAAAGISATAAVTTAYYGGGTGEIPTAPTNTCSGTAVVGLPAKTIDADPDGAGPIQPITHLAVYDSLGRAVGTQVAGDTNWSCTSFDPRGRIATVTDSAAKQTGYNYNDATTPGTITQTYTDSAGTQRTAAAVVDLVGRTARYTDEQGGTTRTVYDQTGRPTDTFRAIFAGTETELTSTGYDSFGRPSGTSDYLSGTARTTNTGYDPQGRPSSTTLPNAVVTTPSYDPDRSYLTGITNVNGTGTHLSDWTYHQTMAGRIDTDTNTGVRTRAYTYDNLGRLTQTVEGATTRRYAYDANTNRCSLAATCDNTWTYNTADRMTASPQGSSYTYNNHGQITAVARLDGKTENISYDGNDHPTTIDNGTTTTTETLAPTGRVLERKVTNNTTHTISEDTLNGYADAADSPAYTRAATGGPVTTYVGATIDIAGTATWQIQNAHNDIVGRTDAVGVYTANPATDEFGVGPTPASRLGYLGGPERFTIDTNLGLIRMGERLYDPTLGSFLSVDPVKGGCANDYTYVHGDPVNSNDPSGRQSCNFNDDNGQGSISGNVFEHADKSLTFSWGAQLNEPWRSWGADGYWQAQITIEGRPLSLSSKGRGSGYIFHGSVGARGNPSTNPTHWGRRSPSGFYSSGSKKFKLERGNHIHIEVEGSSFDPQRGLLTWSGQADCNL